MTTPKRELFTKLGLIAFALAGMAGILFGYRMVSNNDFHESIKTIEVSIINNVMKELKPDDILGELATQKQLLAQGNAQLAELNAQIERANSKLDTLMLEIRDAEETLSDAEN